MNDTDRNNSLDHQELTPSGFSALLNAAVNAIVIIDRTGIILNFNRAAEIIFGYQASEVENKNISILMPEPYRSEHDTYIKNYVATRKTKIIGIGRKVEAIKRDGTIFPIELSVGEYLEGESQYFVGIIRDLSEREFLYGELVKSQAHLRNREQELNVTLKNAPIGILTADLQYHILSANHAACDLMGYKESELSNRNCLEFIHSDDIAIVRQNHSDILNRHKNSFVENVRFVRKDEHIKQVVLHCGSVMGTDNKPEKFVAQLVDITSQVNAEREAQEIRERFAHVDRISTMGEMASGIAHEINQPLTAISSYVQAGLRRLDSDPDNLDKLKELLLKVDEQSQRAATIVRRIRSLIRSHERERECVGVRDVITESVHLASVDSSSRSLELDIDPLSANHEIIVDRVQIQQVILNLLRNAIDAIQETNRHDSRIVIGSNLSPHEHFVEIWVRDFADGVPLSIRENIFESFITSKKTGTGLGLSISRTIVEAHGGNIWAEHLNPGTKFVFSLPLTVSEISDA